MKKLNVDEQLARCICTHTRLVHFIKCCISICTCLEFKLKETIDESKNK